jgi:hypothetical protein
VVLQPNSDLGRLIDEAARSHTIIHTDEWSARRIGRYLQNTVQTQKTNNHALSGIRTRDRSNRAAVDLRLRPHCTGMAFIT